jgi:ChrR Cupin-like domain
MKPHIEFTPVDMSQGWETPPGYKPGMTHKILASDLDEARKCGSRSRLMRIEPGAFSEKPFVHDHWEEVFLLEGDLIVGSDEHGMGGKQFFAPTYACRPPGVSHGPFKSEKGCLLFEVHYYKP